MVDRSAMSGNVGGSSERRISSLRCVRAISVEWRRQRTSDGLEDRSTTHQESVFIVARSNSSAEGSKDNNKDARDADDRPAARPECVPHAHGTFQPAWPMIVGCASERSSPSLASLLLSFQPSTEESSTYRGVFYAGVFGPASLNSMIRRSILHGYV